MKKLELAAARLAVMVGAVCSLLFGATPASAEFRDSRKSAAHEPRAAQIAPASGEQVRSLPGSKLASVSYIGLAPAEMQPVAGSGSGVPVLEAIPRIVPRGWTVFQNGEISARIKARVVDWSASAQPWVETLNSVITPVGVLVEVDGAGRRVLVSERKELLTGSVQGKFVVSRGVVTGAATTPVGTASEAAVAKPAVSSSMSNVLSIAVSAKAKKLSDEQMRHIQLFFGGSLQGKRMTVRSANRNRAEPVVKAIKLAGVSQVRREIVRSVDDGNVEIEETTGGLK